MRRITTCTAAVLLVAGCEDSATQTAVPPSSPSGPIVATELFTEVAEVAGIAFRHEASEGQYYIVEEMGPGGALCDIDGDGDLDLYLVQGGRIFDTEIGEAVPNRLYRNDDGQFVDVTETSGTGDIGYGMGCAAADYDNDGDVDLYVTNVGPDVLLENDGTGRFTDVSVRAGLGLASFSTSAAFVDFDHDGLLDLYVAVYIAWTPAVEVAVFDARGDRDYRNPIAYPPGQDRLYRNRGDGTFEDVTAGAGIGDRPFYGLGVVCSDFDRDGLVDIFVANDHQANFLWMNLGDGTFREAAMERGCAYNDDGKPEAGMGVVSEDLDDDGDFDLLLMHFADETNTFYRNEDGYFSDDTRRTGFDAFGEIDTGFGAGVVDIDNDMRPELFIANGAVNRVRMPLRPDHLYAEPNLLLRYTGGLFEDVTPHAGSAMGLMEMSRGAMFGDYDNDGDVDIVVCNNRGPVHVLRNENRSGHRWIAIRAEGTASNRDGIGAVVTVSTAAGNQRRQVNPHYSYCSSNDVRVHFGLGAARIDAVEIAWPSGLVERWPSLDANRVHRLREGSGTAVGDAGAVDRTASSGTGDDTTPMTVLRQRAERASGRGDWLDAAKTYELIIARTSAEGDRGAEARLSQTLAGLYMQLRDYTRAAEWYERAYGLLVELRGPEDVLAGIALSQLGTARCREGRLEEAEEAVRSALIIMEKATGPESLFSATAHRDLATVLVYAFRFEEAEQHYRYALAIYVKQHGPQHTVSREIAESLAGVQRVRKEDQ